MTEPESSRSRPEGAYDVFLSFRGEDTRKTFTDHLYTALVQAGIHTFRDDDELPRGEEISDHLLRAVQESKISIVVFSKGYASSRWCLNELVEILKCKNRKTGQIVLPIFYDIDPSYVRKQNGSFAEAFVKHEECFEEKLVKEWRKALEEAGNLSGWNLNDMANGHEAKFIKGIIKDVLNKLRRECLYVPEHLVGMDLDHDISDFLSTATDDVRIVGIHGMPGIGKTTIAKVVFNQLCYRFEGSCFLSDINERSKQVNGLVPLQKQLLHDILKQDVADFDCVDRGKVLIKERLRRKRVLVVADNVAHLDQLNALMGDRSWFGPRSRVIITTRYSSLLREADQTYQIKELKPDESLQLFSWHSFKDTKPAEDYIELSKKAVDYCGGLPLALEVIGALLYRKNRGEWESEIDNLSRIPNQDIQGKLLISYHALDGELQRAFLDIACFFIGIEEEYVAKVLGARCRLNPEVVLKTLRERSLIQFHECIIKDERQLFGRTVSVTMHDLLRDMGREVVRESSPLLLGKRTRIWNQEDAWNVLEQQKGTEVVEGLKLDVRASEAKSLSTGSFAKMKCLNLLQINGAHLTGSFKLLSKELMWICWLQCPLKYFPSDFTLDNLAVLDMQYNNLKELWKGKKILNKLKILNLSHSQNLVKTPNLLSSSLEKLILEGCSNLVKVHQSIGHSTSLVFLNLEGCCSLKTLPESIGNVKSLETLNISRCSQLEKLSERMGDMESLTELLADGIENEKFLSSIGQLKHVRRLLLRGYSSAPPSCSLISAGVSNWKRWLPTSFTEWRLVKRLELSNGGLSNCAVNCVDFSGLSALEELNLRGNKFSRLPSGIGFLPKLQVLFVHGCEYLVSIPDLPSSLSYLNASYCESLKRAMCNGRHPYRIYDIRGGMPNWLSYREEGCSLSFHIPPVFHGLVLWFDKDSHYYFDTDIIIIIRNKSNGIQLFKDKQIAGRWIRYISRSEMAMEDYCGDDELELYISSVPTGYAGRNGHSFEPVHVKECGVHVIAGKSDSFEESEVKRDAVMPSPLPYHLLPHPHCGSIRASTPEQWSDYLFAKLREHTLSSRLYAMSNTTSQAASSFTSPSIQDISSPYFLHSADHPGAILVSTLLNGDNYPTWKRAMKMALNAKNKLVFVNGSLSKPTSSVAETQLWERCSDMVLSWILNSIDKSIVSSLIYHACPRDVWLDLEDRFSQSNNPRIFKLKRDIATLTQGSMTISAYFTTLKSHWDELAMLTPTPQCTCGILTELNHMQDTERVFQFLMGLHDSYASIRSQVLAMDPLPPVNKVYSTLHQEEKQRLLYIPSFPTESAAMMAPRHLSHRFDSKGRGRGRLKCDYCDRDGHWRTHCYKLNGYPSNKTQPRGTFDRTSGSSKAANNVIGSSTPAGSSKTENVVTGSSTSTEIAIPGLTSDQYNRLLEFLSPVNTNSANFAGPINEEANWNG